MMRAPGGQRKSTWIRRDGLLSLLLSSLAGLQQALAAASDGMPMVLVLCWCFRCC